MAAVDKTDVRANEAITLTAKLEGRGNLASIGEPKAKWPDGVEIYDSKGVAKAGAGGVGQKIFEFVLIPRAPGKTTLPALELSYFDPTKGAYVTRTTEPIVINVGDPAPGSATPSAAKKRPEASATGAANPGVADEEPAGLKTQSDGGGGDASQSGIPIWRWLYWLCILAIGWLVGLVVWDVLRRNRVRSEASAAARAKAHSRSWARLRESARQAAGGAAWQDVLQAYEVLTGVLFDAIDEAYDVGARSRPRAQLREILVGERGLADETWTKISRLLEYTETVRFASSAGVISDQAARKDLARWVEEGEAVTRALAAIRNPSS